MRRTRHYRKILIKFEFFRRIFEQSSNTKFNENSFIGRRFVSRGQTDETKLIDPIRNVANVPKNWKYKIVWKAMYKHEYITHKWFVIHRDTEHCLSVSVCKFFSVPFSSNCFRREVVVLHGGHDLNILLIYELELCTSITCSLVFDVFGFTDHLFKFWRLSLRFFVPTWSSHAGCTACSGNN